MSLPQQLIAMICHTNRVAGLRRSGISHIGTKDPRVAGSKAVCAFSADSNYGKWFQCPMVAGHLGNWV